MPPIAASDTAAARAIGLRLELRLRFIIKFPNVKTIGGSIVHD